MDEIIECPKHNDRFDYRNGKAKGAPVCLDLKTYAVKVEDGRIFLDLGLERTKFPSRGETFTVRA